MPAKTIAEKQVEKERQFKFVFEHILQLSKEDILYKIFKPNHFKILDRGYHIYKRRQF